MPVPLPDPVRVPEVVPVDPEPFPYDPEPDPFDVPAPDGVLVPDDMPDVEPCVDDPSSCSPV